MTDVDQEIEKFKENLNKIDKMTNDMENIIKESKDIVETKQLIENYIKESEKRFTEINSINEKNKNNQKLFEKKIIKRININTALIILIMIITIMTLVISTME